MADAVDIALADAVVASLAGGTFSEAISPARAFIPKYTLKSQTLDVPVVPAAKIIAGAGRGGSQYDYAVDVGVLKKLGTDKDADGKIGMKLVEEIIDHFLIAANRTIASPHAVAVSFENSPIFDPIHFDELSQFTSVVRIGFRVFRNNG